MLIKRIKGGAGCWELQIPVTYAELSAIKEDIRKDKSIEVLVMDGNNSNAYPLFNQSMLAGLKVQTVSTRIELSELKETASMIRAAVLIDNQHFDKVKVLLLQMS
ncbi:MAG: hypothetical protein H6Q19_2035 [Bacteroidetes bacterium]|nr:hypothetical protein [Bacteroidota bacterium]